MPAAVRLSKPRTATPPTAPVYPKTGSRERLAEMWREVAERDAAESRRPDQISVEHWRVLRERGISAPTAVAANLQTQGDDLCIPHFDLSGRPVVSHSVNGKDFGYAHWRPSHPKTDAKYLFPYGPVKPYFTSMLPARDGVAVVTESGLKALAVSQATGLFCVGVSPWTWKVKDEDEVIPELIELCDCVYHVIVIPDHDKDRNPQVESGYARLVENLSRHRVEAHILRLPVDEFGLPVERKYGPDDFIQTVGRHRFAPWMAQALEGLTRGEPESTIEEHRRRMHELRTDPRAGVTRLDRSPPGTGKSFADIAYLNSPNADGTMPKTLTIETTHVRCASLLEEYRRAGMESEKFPQLTKENCLNHDAADAVMKRGLPMEEVLCEHDCPYRAGCEYRDQYDAAKETQHQIACHERGRLSLPLLAEGRQRITIHECATNVINPAWTHTGGGMAILEKAAFEAGCNARSPVVRKFLFGLSAVAKELHAWLTDPMEVRSREIEVGAQRWGGPRVPQGAYRALNRAYLNTHAIPPADCLRLAVGVLMGDLCVFLQVDRRDEESPPRRSLVGVRKPDAPVGIEHASVLINDATTTLADVTGALGHGAVNDITPPGRLPLHHPVVQVVPAQDVTIRRETECIVPILRGLLYDLPYRRVGLITHMKHAKALPALLTGSERARLVKIDWFHGSESRGSNSWMHVCDVLIVMGTPRIPTETIRQHLLQVGKRRAALMHLTPEQWAGFDWVKAHKGKYYRVRTKGYRDHDWNAAYRSLVVSEIRQAVGRGRGILADGIPVFVVSTEDLTDAGYALAAPDEYTPLTEADAAILSRMRVGAWYTATEVAAMVGVSRRKTADRLRDLVGVGRLRKIADEHMGRGRPPVRWQIRSTGRFMDPPS